MALVAAACGAEASESTDAAAPDAAAGTDTPATTGAAAGTEAPAPSEGAAEPAQNLFPDVDVALIADGSTVNLAEELGGGELPVLLWFFAPH
ncbi:MAG: hypothetical protein AAGD35_20140 [Actinomycetota bacterium]